MNAITAILTAVLGLTGMFQVIFGDNLRQQVRGIVSLTIAALIVIFTGGI